MTNDNRPDTPDENTDPDTAAEALPVVLVDQPTDTPAATPPARPPIKRPIIPPWLRTWPSITAALRAWALLWLHTMAFHAVRLPVYGGRLLRRSPIGTGRLLRELVRWISDAEGHPVRVAMARQENAADYLKLAKLRDQRVKWRAILAATGLLALLVAVLVLRTLPGWASVAVLACLLGGLGYVGMPADQPLISRAVIAGRVQRLTSDVVVRALSVLGIAGISSALAKNQHAVGFTAPITRDGPGWRADIDLPGGVTAADVMERRAKLASGLGRPLGSVWLEGRPDVHPGRLILWAGDQDMNTTKQAPWPLARAGVADLFRPMPIGTDPRGRWVTLALMYTSVIIGAVPRMGKTMFLRLLLLIAALDVRCRLYVFDLKGMGDLTALAKVAHRYRAGDDRDDIAYILAALRELREEMRKRAKRIKALPPDVCPDSKITPQLADVQSLGLFPVVVAIDECHLLFDHPEHGEELAALCEDLVRRGPAAGIIVILATQRPDAKSIPTQISANAVVRICLKVMGQPENDMILGTGAYRNGLKATVFTVLDKGIAQVLGAGDEPQIVHGANINRPAAEEIADRAYSLRKTHGFLTGYATGVENPPEIHEQDTVRALLANILAVIPEDIERMWNETVVDRLAELRPATYGPWAQLDSGAKAAQLTAALRADKITSGQLWGTDPVTGVRANRRGIARADIAAALARHRPGKHRAPDDGTLL
jgi:DNA segregation ATPase FtsK/SpoIIIE, S-DNA-T family